MTKLYSNIKALCDKKGTSISKIVKVAGVPLSTVANWKTERSWMVSLPRIANTLEVTIDNLFNSDNILDNDKYIDEILWHIKSVNWDEKSAKAIIEMIKLISDNHVTMENDNK